MRLVISRISIRISRWRCNVSRMRFVLNPFKGIKYKWINALNRVEEKVYAKSR